jgi:hypothetical protein
MTREEAITYLEDAKIKFKIPKAAVTARKTNEALDMAIKALEQEPVIDKARAEIEKLQTYKMFVGEKTVYVERDDVLAIIDKYKRESEKIRNECR